MPAQLSTSLSDGVLALSAFYTALSCYPISLFAPIGFLLMGAAASLGVIRFALATPGDSLIRRHKYMSSLTASFGFPMIGVAYFLHWKPFLAYTVLAVALVFFLIQQRSNHRLVKVLAEVVGGVSMLLIVVQGLFNNNMYSVIGVGLFAFAAMVIKTEGYLFSMPRVDLFHYVLVLANIALKQGLEVSKLPDIYYKPQ